METLDFLLDRPFTLLVLLFLGGLVGMAIERSSAKALAAKRRARWRKRRGQKNGYTKGFEKAERDLRARKSSKADFAAEQLKAVSAAKFSARTLLNKPEAKVFETLDQAVIARNPKWQVMAQVNLGEFLASPCNKAFRAINTKRVDFALIDADCRVVHALEYQGSGHHVRNCAAARDAVKKEALRKAGIGYHEVVAGHTTPADLKALVERLVTAPGR